jgi:hypothetical protein
MRTYLIGLDKYRSASRMLFVGLLALAIVVSAALYVRHAEWTYGLIAAGFFIAAGIGCDRFFAKREGIPEEYFKTFGWSFPKNGDEFRIHRSHVDGYLRAAKIAHMKAVKTKETFLKTMDSTATPPEKLESSMANLRTMNDEIKDAETALLESRRVAKRVFSTRQLAFYRI